MYDAPDALSRAAELEDREEYALALEECERVIESGLGDQAMAHRLKARLLAKMNHLSDALAECQIAKDLNPDMPGIDAIIGRIYFQEGKYNRAEQAFKNALCLMPDDETVLSYLVRTYNELGKIPEAIEYTEEFLRYQPRNAVTRAYLSELYIQQHRVPRATLELWRALMSSPTQAHLYPLYFFILTKAFASLNILLKLAISLVCWMIAIAGPLWAGVAVGGIWSFLTLVLIVSFVYLGSKEMKSQRRFLLGVAVRVSVYVCFYWLFLAFIALTRSA
ncbi:MAG: hypothetical protein GX620_01995 [Chloroflexi bacterium]|nr:hypothetical protein [Chloroflexota bacterium]